jgi:hypothetical protein
MNTLSQLPALVQTPPQDEEPFEIFADGDGI